MASRKKSIRVTDLNLSKRELAEARKFLTLVCRENIDDEQKIWPMALAREFAPKIAQKNCRHFMVLQNLFHQIEYSFSFNDDKLAELFGLKKDDLNQIYSFFEAESARELNITKVVKPLKKVLTVLKLDERETERLIYYQMSKMVEHSIPWGKIYYDPDDIDSLCYAANNREVDDEINDKARKLTQKIMTALKKQ